jgi:hypothetical protein
MEHMPLYLTRASKLQICAWVTAITDLLGKKCRNSKWDYKNNSSVTITPEVAKWHHTILQQRVQGVIIIKDVKYETQLQN